VLILSDLRGLAGVDGGVVPDPLADAPQEDVGRARPHPLEPGPEPLDDEVVVVGPVDGVEPALEVAVLPCDALELSGVVDRCQDLLPVPDDAGILDEAPDALRAIGGDLAYVEVVESLLEVGPFVGHELPAEAGLEDDAGEVLEVLPVGLGSRVGVDPAGQFSFFGHGYEIIVGFFEGLGCGDDVILEERH